MAKKHAILSPSASKRWMTCAGSAFLCKGLPNVPSPYAEEGTRAHAMAERLLRGAMAGEMLPSQIPEFPQLGMYIRYVLDLVDKGYTVFIETRVPLFNVTGEENAFGIADCVAILGDTIEIVDLKWGAGVPVDAVDNTQMGIYALGAMDEFSYLGPFKNVRMTIVQPRVNEAPVSWDTTANDMERFRAEVRVSADYSIAMYNGSIQPVYTPCKEACRWCLANKICKACAEMVHETTSVEFPDLGEEPVLTPANRAALFKRLDDVRAWVETFEKGVLEDALNGVKFPGLKLVKGRAGARKWADEQAADDALSGFSVSTDDRYERKLVSPTSVEKLYKAGLLTDDQWGELKKLVCRAEPKLVLVPDSDKRPAVEPTDTAALFDDVSK